MKNEDSAYIEITLKLNVKMLPLHIKDVILFDDS